MHLYGGEKTDMLKFLLIFFTASAALASNAFLYTTPARVGIPFL